MIILVICILYFATTYLGKNTNDYYPQKNIKLKVIYMGDIHNFCLATLQGFCVKARIKILLV